MNSGFVPRVRAVIVAGLAALAVALPVHAADERTPSDLEAALEQMLTPEAWLGGRITEADVELLFAYLRASLIASAYGQEVPVPPELKRRAETLGRELRAHGVLAGILLLQALEARAKQALPVPSRSAASDRSLGGSVPCTSKPRLAPRPDYPHSGRI